MTSDADLLLASIARHRQAMVDLTQELIRIPTENPPGARYHDAADLLVAWLRSLAFDEVRREGDCVLAFVGRGNRTLYFSGHYDVVPAQRLDQFAPEIHHGKIIGRGAADMKGGLAAMIYAAITVRDHGRLNGSRIGVVLVPDEETAGPRGSKHLAEKGMLGSDGVGMLTPEPTDGVVWNGSRGAISLRITVYGKHAHVGRQREGVNAFDGMLSIAQELSSLKQEVERHATSFRIAPEASRHSILMLGGRIEGGSNFNVVPDRCSFTVDRRLNPEEDFETEKARLLAAIDRGARAQIDYAVSVIQEARASASDEGGLMGRVLGRCIEEVTGREAQFELCPGLLETRFYTERGVPAFAYGPGLLTVSHGPEEFVSIDRIEECAKIYALTAARVLETTIDVPLVR